MFEGRDLLNKLSYERMLNLVQEVDDEVRIQKEYYEKRLPEELAQDLEDQMLIRDIKTYVQKKPEARGFESKF